MDWSTVDVKEILGAVQKVGLFYSYGTMTFIETQNLSEIDFRLTICFSPSPRTGWMYSS
jgi:hypothetical protein